MFLNGINIRLEEDVLAVPTPPCYDGAGELNSTAPHINLNTRRVGSFILRLLELYFQETALGIHWIGSSVRLRANCA
jgi:hypothetical protein